MKFFKFFLTFTLRKGLCYIYPEKQTVKETSMMEYTVKKLALLSGVSSRTLRYYDEIGLLKPARINSSGYRIYGAKEVDRLQQILYYRKMDLKLEDIQQLLDQPDFDNQKALEAHYQALLEKRQQIDLLLHTVAETLRYYKGERTMSDTEKFAAFKQEKFNENERLYGDELAKKYSKESRDASNQNWLAMDEASYLRMQEAEATLIESLNQLLSQKADLNSDLAKKAFAAHKEWLSIAAPFYTTEYHRNLAEMYVNDARFAHYYNEKTKQDSVKLLKQIIDFYAHD